MENKSGLYLIQNLQTAPGQGRGGYGPTIILDGDVVKTIIENETKRDESLPLFKMVKDNLLNSVLEFNREVSRIGFFEDTWLLTNMSLGMDCACFSIDGNTRSALQDGEFKSIRYNPHNIDDPHTGAVIVSTWLLWFNHIIAMTEFEQPFAM